MDLPFECLDVVEGLVGEMVGLEVVPDDFDVVEFGRVLRQPFDREPVLASLERGPRGLAKDSFKIN